MSFATVGPAGTTRSQLAVGGTTGIDADGAGALGATVADGAGVFDGAGVGVGAGVLVGAGVALGAWDVTGVALAATDGAADGL
ncbi:MAG TPA: hypothetical protein VID95_04160, partial [Candidatus Limnocylindrales bacterium]